AAVRRTVTDLAKGVPHAVAAVNASYFIMPDDPDSLDTPNIDTPTDRGIPGAPAGATAIGGVVEGLPVANRPAVQLTTDGPTFLGNMTAITSARAGDGSTRIVTGVNRIPGAGRNCGSLTQVGTWQQPEQDKTCPVPDDLVEFSSNLGVPLPATSPPIVIVSNEKVMRRAQPGDQLNPGEIALAGTGTSAAWLTEQATTGAVMSVSVALAPVGGQAIDLSKGDLVSGGPTLVKDSIAQPNSTEGGFAQPDDPSKTLSWVIRKTARIAYADLGVGRTAFVVVDGRQAGKSEGFGIPDFARYLKSLGARQAINLDAGGSTTMVVKGKVVNRPSDPRGQRPVGDAIVITSS
ncbi:MAG: phosphodiester glycosidase family protein, partial [Mycobacterium sp.]|nr:phosphodiester glycosidase family protein [Mycobacterium sp.]